MSARLDKVNVAILMKNKTTSRKQVMRGISNSILVSYLTIVDVNNNDDATINQ
jgi:hypothetical protein